MKLDNPFRHLKEYAGELEGRLSRLGVKFDNEELLRRAESFLELLDARQEFSGYSPRNLAKYVIAQCFPKESGSLNSKSIALHHLLLPESIYDELQLKRNGVNNKMRREGKEPNLYAQDIKLHRIFY